MDKGATLAGSVLVVLIALAVLLELDVMGVHLTHHGREAVRVQAVGMRSAYDGIAIATTAAVLDLASLPAPSPTRTSLIHQEANSSPKQLGANKSYLITPALTQLSSPSSNSLVARAHEGTVVLFRGHALPDDQIERLAEYAVACKNAAPPISIWLSLDTTDVKGEAKRVDDALQEQVGNDIASTVAYHEYTTKDMYREYPGLREAHQHVFSTWKGKSLALGFHTEVGVNVVCFFCLTTMLFCLCCPGESK
jgi:hypothetical protein